LFEKLKFVKKRKIHLLCILIENNLESTKKKFHQKKYFKIVKRRIETLHEDKDKEKCRWESDISNKHPLDIIRVSESTVNS